MLTVDRSFVPFGDPIDGYFRGGEWSDGDRAEPSGKATPSEIPQETKFLRIDRRELSNSEEL